jgi:hypothetical protein
MSAALPLLRSGLVRRVAAIDQALRRFGRRPCPLSHCVYSGFCLCDGLLVCATFDDNVMAVELYSAAGHVL